MMTTDEVNAIRHLTNIGLPIHLARQSVLVFGVQWALSQKRENAQDAPQTTRTASDVVPVQPDRPIAPQGPFRANSGHSGGASDPEIRRSKLLALASAHLTPQEVDAIAKRCLVCDKPKGDRDYLCGTHSKLWLEHPKRYAQLLKENGLMV